MAFAEHPLAPRPSNPPEPPGESLMASEGSQPMEGGQKGLLRNILSQPVGRIAVHNCGANHQPPNLVRINTIQ